MHRRSFLAALGAGALGSLAGCQTAVGAVALPDVPESRLKEGGWELRNRTKNETVFKKEYSFITVEAVASSVLYADAALRKEVRQDTLGAIDTDLALFSATRIDMAPSVDELGPVQAEVEDRIQQQAIAELKGRMQAAGIADIERTETASLDVASGVSAELTELSGVYRVPDIEFPVREDTTITIQGTDLSIEALLAVWAANGNYLVTGGAYPAENFARVTETDLSEAISVTIDVDLGLTPAAYREELLGLMRNVS
ncbi:MAG: hypothetical protein ABEJ84_07650 [Halodesulfurarchaeum sp.]